MADSPDDSSGLKRRRVVNRPRPIVSCLSCRSRKLRCDRESPCAQCTRAGRASTCSYAAVAPGSRESGRQASSSEGLPSPRPDPHRAGITPLTNGSASWTSPNRQDSQEPKFRIEDCDRGRPYNQPTQVSPSVSRPAEILKKKGTRTRYTQADFKQAMLEKFPEAQKYGGSVVQDPSIARSMDEFFRLFKDLQRLGSRWLDDVEGPGSCDLNNLLRLLPPKSVCDRLVASYFAIWEQTFRILHRPTFLRSYEEFWSTLGHGAAQKHAWMGFQIAAVIAVVSSPTTTSKIQVDSTQDVPRRLCAKLCIFLMTWTERLSGKGRTEMTTLQTQTLLVLAKILLQIRWDEVWYSTGGLIRSAMSMGLHRDPSTFPQLTVFEGELRRRLFSTIVEFEMLSSAAAGMPCMTKPMDFDTDPPCDAEDGELIPTMDQLPQSPSSELRIDSLPQCVLARSQRLRLTIATTAPTPGLFDELEPIIEEGKLLEKHIDLLMTLDQSDRTQARIWNLSLVAAYLQRTILQSTRPIAFYGCGQSNIDIIRARSMGLDSSLMLLHTASSVDALDYQMRAAFNILTKNGASTTILQICSEIKEDNIDHIQRPAALLKQVMSHRQPVSRKMELRRAIRVYHDRMLRKPLEIGLDGRDMLWLAIVMSDAETDDRDKQPAMRRRILEVMTVCREQMLRKRAVRSASMNGAMHTMAAPPPSTMANDPLDAYFGTGTEMAVDLQDILNFDFSFLEEYSMGASPELIMT